MQKSFPNHFFVINLIVFKTETKDKNRECMMTQRGDWKGSEMWFRFSISVLCLSVQATHIIQCCLLLWIFIFNSSSCYFIHQPQKIENLLTIPNMSLTLITTLLGYPNIRINNQHTLPTHTHAITYTYTHSHTHT